MKESIGRPSCALSDHYDSTGKEEELAVSGSGPAAWRKQRPSSSPAKLFRSAALRIALSMTLASTFILLNISCGGKQPRATSEKPAKRVPVETIAGSTVDDYYEAVGTVKSKTSSALSPKVMGTIIGVHVKEGDRVRAGQLLVEIDNRDSQAQLDKARAGLREAQGSINEVDQSTAAAAASLNAAQSNRSLAEATYKRYRVLLDRKSVSPQEFDEVETRDKAAAADVERTAAFLNSLQARKSQAQARVEQAKAEVNAAQVTLGYFRITSPMNGTVTVKQAEPGATASPGMPLLTVESDSNYRLEAAVEDSQSDKIQIGGIVDISLDLPGAAILSGRVSEIVRASDPSSRSFTVRIDLPLSDNGKAPTFRSGMYGKARFAVGHREAILVPSSAIVERGQLTGVYTVDDSGRAQLRLVKTGKGFGDKVEILSGLSHGDRIVVAEIGSIAEGEKVQATGELNSLRTDR